MWENRCKVAVSGVGFSKITRSAAVPLAAHALQAVKAGRLDATVFQDAKAQGSTAIETAVRIVRHRDRDVGAAADRQQARASFQ